MSLNSEVNEQLRVLLDKPASSFSYRQITQLIGKEIIEAQILIPMFTAKYRADLILTVLQSYPVGLATTESLLVTLRRDILKYQAELLNKVWGFILKHQSYKHFRQEWGLSTLLAEGLRRTNQQAKESLLWLLSSNLQVLGQSEQNGTLLHTFGRNYCQLYVKQVIYLAPFPALALQCIDLAAEASLGSPVLLHTLTLLVNTKSKNLYLFQNYCLKLIAHVLQSQKDLILDGLDIQRGLKIIEDYLYKKPTREQARGAHQALKTQLNKLNQEQKSKMMFLGPSYEKDRLEQPPLLIENVIEKVNEYRAHKHSNSALKVVTSPSKLLSGKRQINKGKTALQDKRTTQLEQLIEMCLSNSQENKFMQQVQPQSVLEKNISVTSQAVSSRAEDYEQFDEISDLIDLAYEYKFG